MGNLSRHMEELRKLFPVYFLGYHAGLEVESSILRCKQTIPERFLLYLAYKKPLTLTRDCFCVSPMSLTNLAKYGILVVLFLPYDIFIVYLKSSIYSMSSLIHSRLIPMPCPSSPMNVTDKLNRSSGLVMFITYQFSIVTDGRSLTDQEEQTFALIRHIGLDFKTISFNMGNTNLVTATLEYLKPVYL